LGFCIACAQRRMSLTWMSSMISPPPIGTPIQRSMSEVSN
jgi:hypothetical protein